MHRQGLVGARTRDDVDTLDLLFEAVAAVPEEIMAALMGARLTALAKPDGSVRGIATGSSLQRLVARTLAKQFASEFEAEYRSSTRCPLERARTVSTFGPRRHHSECGRHRRKRSRPESCHDGTIGDHAKGSWHLAYRVPQLRQRVPCTIGGMTRVGNAQSCRLKEASRATL